MGEENVYPENWDVVLALSALGDKACFKVLFFSCKGSSVKKQMPQSSRSVSTWPMYNWLYLALSSSRNSIHVPFSLDLEKRIHNGTLCGQQEGREERRGSCWHFQMVREGLS